MKFKLRLILSDRNPHSRDSCIHHYLLVFVLLTLQATATEGQEANVITDYILKVILPKALKYIEGYSIRTKIRKSLLNPLP